MTAALTPDVTRELELATEFGWPVFSMDEVGRGSVAGPVHVGVASLDEASLSNNPPAVRDSKALSRKARGDLYQAARVWACVEVGEASAAEVDTLGIMAALRLAAERAIVAHQRAGRSPSVILLDGSYDWLSRATQAPAELRADHAVWDSIRGSVQVITHVKADASCTGVAAASVVAKVQRDEAMSKLSENYPGYGFENNAGYATKAHIEAIRKNGLSEVHRRTFCERFYVPSVAVKKGRSRS